MLTHSGGQIITSVVVETDLSDKKLHRQAGVDGTVTSEMCGVIVNRLMQIARDVGSIPALGVLFPIFIIIIKLVP